MFYLYCRLEEELRVYFDQERNDENGQLDHVKRPSAESIFRSQRGANTFILRAPLMTSWTSPPTRRELTLLLFCVTVFVIAYNASTSLRLIGFNFSSRPAPIGTDGRRPEGYRDRLENEIFGEWDWDPGHIAAVKEAESARVMHGKTYDNPDAYIRGEGLTGEQTMWLQGVGEGRYGQGEGLGSTSVNDELVRWGENVPLTELKQHVPGASSIRSVTMLSARH